MKKLEKSKKQSGVAICLKYLAEEVKSPVLHQAIMLAYLLSISEK